MSDHHEARLLLAILREDWECASAIVGQAAPRPGVFVDLARACDVYPWVHAVLERAARSDLVGTEAWESLTRMRHKCRNDNLLLLAHTEQVLDLLLEAGIVPVALKGLDFLHRFYERFDERSMDDVDLLVLPEQLSTNHL